MTIGEVSKEYQISIDTLRYYEKVGLIEPVPKKSGQRVYEENSLERIRFIQCMKNAGFSLKEIVRFINYNEEDQMIPKRLEMLLAQKEKLLAEMKEKEKTLDFLNYKINFYQNKKKEKEK